MRAIAVWTSQDRFIHRRTRDPCASIDGLSSKRNRCAHTRTGLQKQVSMATIIMTMARIPPTIADQAWRATAVLM